MAGRANKDILGVATVCPPVAFPSSGEKPRAVESDISGDVAVVHDTVAPVGDSAIYAGDEEDTHRPFVPL